MNKEIINYNNKFNRKDYLLKIEKLYNKYKNDNTKIILIHDLRHIKKFSFFLNIRIIKKGYNTIINNIKLEKVILLLNKNNTSNNIIHNIINILNKSNNFIIEIKI